MKHSGGKFLSGSKINKISIFIFVFLLFGGSARAATFVVNSTADLPDGGDGIDINAGGGDQIGGTNAGDGNIIAFNLEDGVQIDDVGVTPAGHSILGNSIFSNGGLGINLSIDGVTANDAGDADAGANNQQTFPVITTALPGNARVIGTFNSNANTTFRLEFFNSPSPDASGFGEGKFFIGSINVTSDASGNANFDQTFAFNVVLNSYISATATNLTTNDTSEFSGSKIVSVPTAAAVSVGGRVSDEFGRGLANVKVSITDLSGNSHAVLTNQFGYYFFKEVSAGETYILSAKHKNFRFTQPIVSPFEDIYELQFIGSPGF